MKLYVQFPEEPLYVAIAQHDDDPFVSIQECKDFVMVSEEVGRTFNIVDVNGRVYFSGQVTYEGIIEITADDLE